MTGFRSFCLRRVVTLAGAQLFKFLKGGFLCWGQMADVTFQSGFCLGSFWGRGADGGTLGMSSVHIVVFAVQVDGEVA